MLHIPELEPTDEELQDPVAYFKKLRKEQRQKLKDLTKLNFEVKIIDYGLSCILQSGKLADTPHGTFELIAPEVLDTSYD